MMAHGKNAEQGAHPGNEYWSKRPGIKNAPISCRPGTNKITKRITHKIERAQAKRRLKEK